ncbi:DUF3310 domain-containing protein [Pseudomonas sp. GD03855]|nr:DUF3310 domain-containing protein [Pseudomonas sp. GD03856]MDH2263898.1 DUF3310 domain-containing protein [Pseudomonas sp. GD03855]
MTDAINPTHYTRGGVECIDAIESATVDKRGIEAACTANIIKYLWRYEAKNGIEDVKKARWYLERLLAHLGNVQEAQFGQQNTLDYRTDEQKGFNDPRTVVGVDVSFPTEKHMNFAPECEHNFEDHGSYRFGSRGQQLTILNCGKCGAEQVEAEDE